MEKLNFLIILSVLISAVQSDGYPKSGALYCTTYIENGQISQARKLAEVNYRGMAGVKSYSGYLTVNKTYNSNMFFWYFPAKINSSTVPTFLYLAGGPGLAGAYPFFMETGSHFINRANQLEPRKYTLHKYFNMLYFDNPVGTGYSYTENLAGYARNQIDVATNLIEALKQFYKLFPEIMTNPFYIGGESYAGKYVPALSHAIHENNIKLPKCRINLKGLIIANGIIDPINQLEFGEYLYQLGFIDFKALATFTATQNKAAESIKQNDTLSALLYMSELVNTNGCLFYNLTNFSAFHNYLKPDGYNKEFDIVTDFMNKSDIHKYLHVGDRTFYSAVTTNVLNYLLLDIEASVIHWLVEAIKYYKVLVYNGQLDLLAFCESAEKLLRNSNFTDKYDLAQRKIYTVDNEPAGFYKTIENLTHVCVRLAGHLAGIDQPYWVLKMILKFINGESL